MAIHVLPLHEFYFAKWVPMINPRFLPLTKWQTVPCHMNPLARDEATRWCRSCVLRFWETQWADTLNTWKLSGIIYSMQTVEMCNSSVILDTVTLSFSKQTFPSSSWQLGHCIRRPIRTWITFWRLAAMCEFVESHLVTVEQLEKIHHAHQPNFN